MNYKTIDSLPTNLKRGFNNFQTREITKSSLICYKYFLEKNLTPSSGAINTINQFIEIFELMEKNKIDTMAVTSFGKYYKVGIYFNYSKVKSNIDTRRHNLIPYSPKEFKYDNLTISDICKTSNDILNDCISRLKLVG